MNKRICTICSKSIISKDRVQWDFLPNLYFHYWCARWLQCLGWMNGLDAKDFKKKGKYLKEEK